MGGKIPRTVTLTKVVDDTSVLHCKCGIDIVLREEVMQDGQGRVVTYNLAFIHFGMYQKDNGRVLGVHHRHFMGSVETVQFTSYESILTRFLDEVEKLRRKHEQEHQGRKL
jgi:hypothetical protein